jgi:hypothetical protein
MAVEFAVVELTIDLYVADGRRSSESSNGYVYGRGFEPSAVTLQPATVSALSLSFFLSFTLFSMFSDVTKDK